MNGYDLRLAQGHQIDSPIVQGSNVHFPPPPPQQQPIYHQPVQPIPYQPNMQLAQPIHQPYSYYQQPNQPIYHARNTQPQMYQPPAHYNNTFPRACTCCTTARTNKAPEKFDIEGILHLWAKEFWFLMLHQLHHSVVVWRLPF